MTIIDNIFNLIEESKIPLRGRIAANPKIAGLRHLRERIKIDRQLHKKRKKG